MVMQSFVEKISAQFMTEFRHERTVRFFCKTVYVYFILKIIFSWPTWTLLVTYYPPRFSHSFINAALFLPAQWAQAHLDLFCWFSLLIILVAVFIRLNYFSSAIIFWIAINVYKINFPVANGSDLVLLMLLAFTLPMSHYPEARKPFWKLVQLSTFNIGVFLCQVHIVLIYVVSGWDKVLSASWRSGEAFQHIASLDYLFNPTWIAWAPVQPVVNFGLAWVVILFELSFPLLVWFSKTRWIILIAGMIFHLVIWVFLSLPDFGLMMIVSYIIFLKAEDFSWLTHTVKPVSINR